jgi:hypothetical protein
MAQNGGSKYNRQRKSRNIRLVAERKKVSNNNSRVNSIRTLTYMASGIRSPFPNRYRTKLFLNVPCQIKSGAPAFDYHTIKHNSIVAPFDTANPLPFAPSSSLTPSLTYPHFSDAFSLIYDRYVVLGCKISLEVLPTSAADDVSYAISAAQPGGASLVIDDASSQPHSRGPILAQASRMGGKANIYVSTMALASKDPINDDVYSGPTNFWADPSTIYRYDFTYRTLTGSIVTSTISVMVRLEYDVEFYSLSSSGNGSPLLNAIREYRTAHLEQKFFQKGERKNEVKLRK